MLFTSKSTSIYYFIRTGEEGKLNPRMPRCPSSEQHNRKIFLPKRHLRREDFLYNSVNWIFKNKIIWKDNETAAPHKLAQMLITMYRSMALYESDLHRFCCWMSPGLSCTWRWWIFVHLLERKAPKSSSYRGFVGPYKGDFAPDTASGLFTVQCLRSDFTAGAFWEAWHLQLTPEGI